MGYSGEGGCFVLKVVFGHYVCLLYSSDAAEHTTGRVGDLADWRML